MNLTTIQSLFKEDKMLWTTHCAERLHERDISYDDIAHCIATGEIIEDYPDDFPHPSCLIFGYDCNNMVIHVIVGYDGNTLYMITAYHPSTDKFEDDLKTRKEN